LIDSEQIEHAKTKYLHEIVAPYEQDKLLFLTEFDVNINFKLASQNINNVSLYNAHEINVLNILKNDWIVASVKGLS